MTSATPPRAGRWAAILLALGLCFTFLVASVDLDSDGLPDPWQLRFGAQGIAASGDEDGDQTQPHADLLAELSEAIKQFYDATVQLGIQDNVTTFTASDFGRTFPTNGQGSDHGWGNHQMIVGGAAQGGDIYGSMPVLEVDGPNDTGYGRWIPTTSVDEYSATLAKWFGVSAGDLQTVFPNLGRFSRPDLGFLA